MKNSLFRRIFQLMLMDYIFSLSGDYTRLAKEEITSLFSLKYCRVIGRLLIADMDSDEEEFNKAARRLSLTKKICRLLFECKAGELPQSMNKYDWNTVYRSDFCVRVYDFNKNHQKKFTEKDLAAHVWNSLKNPKVSLNSPKTAIEIFIIKDKAFCGLAVHSNAEKFELRKPHLRQFTHPSSLHPKIARALVNISCARESNTVLDPFCGTGGFLIEAGLMGIKTVGYDINKEMAEGCKENMKNFKIRDFKIFNRNALKISHKFDYAVTDLPYGLNSNVILEHGKGNWRKFRINKKIQNKGFAESLEDFYLLFLKSLRKKLKKKAVIIFPSYANRKKLLKASKFRIESEFSIYVHRSLTRRIVKIS